MAFKFNLSKEARACLTHTRQEMARLYVLPDRWLGEALLKLAREARQEQPELLSDPLGQVYDANFVWHIVPHIAKRLGVTELQLNENRRVELHGEPLRAIAGIYLKKPIHGSAWRKTRS